MNFQLFKLVLEKAEEPEIKLPTSAGSWKKQESSRKTSISALLTICVLQGLPYSSNGKESACNAGDLGSIPGSGRSSGEGNGNPPSFLAWRTAWTEELGWLWSMGLQRVIHDSATNTICILRI